MSAILIPDEHTDPPSGERSDVSDRQYQDPSMYVEPYVDPSFGNLLADASLYAEPYDERRQSEGPSLPIVLISAACGIAGGVLGLYISYGALGLGLAVSAGAATLGLLFGLGVSGATLTAVTGERGAAVNMAFSCGLVVLVMLFMAMCAVTGAAVATLLLRA